MIGRKVSDMKRSQLSLDCWTLMIWNLPGTGPATCRICPSGILPSVPLRATMAASYCAVVPPGKKREMTQDIFGSFQLGPDRRAWGQGSPAACR